MMGTVEVFIFLFSLGTVASFPQTPFFDFQAFPVPAVTPSSIYPAPKYEPVYHKPQPVYHKPKPVYNKPEPVYHRHAPEYHKPKPVYHKSAPLYHSAGPPYHPAPQYTPKIPKVYAKHPTTYTKPKPLPAFVNLGPGPYHPSYIATTAPVEEEASVDKAAPVEEAAPTEEAVPVKESPTVSPYQPTYTTAAPVAPDNEVDVKTQEIVEVAADDVADVVDDVTDVVEDISESDKSSSDSKKPEKLVIELTTTKTPKMEKTTRRVPVVMKTKGTASVKRVPVMMRTRTMTTTTTTTAPKKLTMSKEMLDDLVEMAVERLHEMEENIQEMEELKEDGLVVLEPQAGGDIISVDSEATLDGMNVVEFDSVRL